MGNYITSYCYKIVECYYSFEIHSKYVISLYESYCNKQYTHTILPNQEAIANIKSFFITTTHDKISLNSY